MNYSDQLKSEQWQVKRGMITTRDNATCRLCGLPGNQVHHKYYIKGRMAWEYGDDAYITLCASCHTSISENGGVINCIIYLDEQNQAKYIAVAEKYRDIVHKIVYEEDTISCLADKLLILRETNKGGKKCPASQN